LEDDGNACTPEIKDCSNTGLKLTRGSNDLINENARTITINTIRNLHIHVAGNKVYVTRKFPGDGLRILAKQCNVVLNSKPTPPSRKELLRKVSGADGILCMLSDKIDKEVMKAAGPQLRVISSYSTGFEHIDVKEATARGIYVTFTADTLAEALETTG
jgi:D-isomer specific 2-hydroxyacid dehydrogenase-like protein